MSLKTLKKKRNANIINTEFNINTLESELDQNFDEIIEHLSILKLYLKNEKYQYKYLLSIESNLEKLKKHFGNVFIVENIEKLNRVNTSFNVTDIVDELTNYILNIKKNISTKLIFSLGSFTDTVYVGNQQIILYSLRKAMDFFFISCTGNNYLNFFIKIWLISIGRESIKLGVSISRDSLDLFKKNSNSFISLPTYLAYNKKSLSYFQEKNLMLIEKLNNMIGAKSFISEESSIEEKYAINYVFEFPNTDKLEKLNKNGTHNKGTFLIVEDSIFNQKQLYRILTSLGYNSVIANNGKEALDLTLLEKFDLIFMDLEMPEMDGYESATRINRKENINYKTPIILQTSNKDVQLKSFKKIFKEQVSKPYVIHEIEKVIKKYLIQEVEGFICI